MVTPARLIAAVCVIVPFVAVLWVPIFDKDKPEVAGFPFFFWWQLLWVAITAVLMALAYFVVRREEVARKTAAASAIAEVAPAPEPAVEPEAVAKPEEASEETTEEAPEEGDAE